MQARQSARVVGVEYDPQTKEIRGDASGQFNSRHGRLVGNIKLTDKKFQIDQGRSQTITAQGNEVSMYQFAKEGKYKRESDDRGLQFQIQSMVGKDISGIADHGVGSEKYAFRMRPVSEGKKSEIREDIIRRIQRDGDK